MLVTSQSSIAQSEVLQASINRVERNIAIANEEVSTGRHSDEGVALGPGAKDLVLGRQLLTQLESAQRTSGVVSTRLTAIQSVLSAVRDLAEGFAASLATAGQSGDKALISQDAKTRFEALTRLLSTAVDGVYLFGGANSSQRPVKDGAGSSGTTLATAGFQAAFGFAITDPQSAALPASDLGSYLDGPFSEMFNEPSWKANFSLATDDGIVTPLSENETVQSTQSINEPDIRKLFKAFVCVMSIEGADLNKEAVDLVLSKSLEWTMSVSAGIASIQGHTGLFQQRIVEADSEFSWKKDWTEKRIAEWQSINQAEAGVRLNSLSAQLQTTFALTARLQKISLLEYI